MKKYLLALAFLLSIGAVFAQVNCPATDPLAMLSSRPINLLKPIDCERLMALGLANHVIQVPLTQSQLLDSNYKVLTSNFKKKKRENLESPFAAATPVAYQLERYHFRSLVKVPDSAKIFVP
ncbi:MAG: hypothetical protein ACK4TA_02445 [Saprospiraceae bacterium]